MTFAIDTALLLDLAAIVAKAGASLPRRNRREGLAKKPDGSIVTAADVACEQALCAMLAQRLPGLTVVSEESAPADGVMPDADTVALIDPLDGTSAYADGRDDYSVNLAIVRGGVAVLGLLAIPAQGFVFGGLCDGLKKAAWRMTASPEGQLDKNGTPITVADNSAGGLIGLISERHGDAHSEAALARAGITQRIAASSASKFALIADGRGHLYPRFGPTMVWDTAAGQALLEAAGGCVIDPRDGMALRYAAQRPLRNGAFIAASSLPLARLAAALPSAHTPLPAQ
ncbi:MAG: 3'(2'),5'-bisphosphate nucleotidase CysQ family protein [Beijerinckiaceae bacterium]